MKRNAYEETTIRKVAKLLRHLQRNCNTKDPETVKLYIAKKTTSNGHKENLVEAYAIHLRSQNLTWERPFYQRYDKKRRPPKEELIDFLINHARLEMALKLSMTKDLGERPVELTWLTVADINLQNGIVNITGAKHTVGRNGKLKANTLEMLKKYINKNHLNANDRLFQTRSEHIRESYRKLSSGKHSESIQKIEICSCS